MKPNVNRLKELMAVRRWSASELARQMGVSRSETTRLLNGKRNGGNKVISGLIKAFPEESLETLFFLLSVYPNVNTNDNSVSVKKPPGEHQSIPIKHPNAHQLACTVNEDVILDLCCEGVGLILGIAGYPRIGCQTDELLRLFLSCQFGYCFSHAVLLSADYLRF